MYVHLVTLENARDWLAHAKVDKRTHMYLKTHACAMSYNKGYPIKSQVMYKRKKVQQPIVHDLTLKK